MFQRKTASLAAALTVSALVVPAGAAASALAGAYAGYGAAVVPVDGNPVCSHLARGDLYGYSANGLAKVLIGTGSSEGVGAQLVVGGHSLAGAAVCRHGHAGGRPRA
jgi:hypothetical protein